jgi:ketosteroid isomerase-like protein
MDGHQIGGGLSTMPIDYATAGELLETFGRAWQTFDGDLIVSLFTEDAEYHEDPFGSPMVGHNAIRAYWLDGASTTEQVEFTAERHWMSGDVVLAAWHASFVERASSARVRLAGFMTWDLAADGRISRLREWTVQAPDPASAG